MFNKKKGQDKSVENIGGGSRADVENRIVRKVGIMKSMASRAKRGKDKVSDKYTSTRDKFTESPIFKFLKNLAVTLIGFLAFRSILIQMFNKELPKIERFLKMLLKDKLKEVISCDLDAPIPTYLRYNNQGVDIRMDHIDFNKLLLTDPTSEEGKMLYDDPLSGINSKGFDTFLHYVTKSPNQDWGWGHQISGQDIFIFNFKPTGSPAGNNVVNIRASSYYTNNKRLLDLNNDYIDSLRLFPAARMMSGTVDATFSPLTYSVHIPKAWLLQKEEVDLWLDKIGSAEEIIDIDDSFFEFTNDEMAYMNGVVEEKSNGVRKLASCDAYTEVISFETLTATTANMLSATTSGSYVDLTDTIENTFNTISSEATGNAPEKDKFKFEMEFFSLMFDGLKSVMGTALVTPKVVTLLQVNNKIMYGENAPPYETIPDLIYKNKVIYNALMKLLVTIISAVIVSFIIKALQKLIQENKSLQQAEAIDARLGQLMSLVGTSIGGIKETAKMLSSIGDMGIPTDFSGSIGG